MFAGLIQKRVMKALREHVSTKQREYETGVKEIEAEAESKKEKLADTIVDEILTKIL